MKILVAITLLSLCGCSKFSYTNPSGYGFKRTGFGTKLAVGTFEMRTDTNGVTLIKFKSLNSDQVEIASAITAAAVAAAIQSQTGGLAPAATTGVTIVPE